MPQTVLITGGTGMVGRRLTTLLQKKGYQVAYLSRKQVSVPDVKVHYWDLAKGQIDEKALLQADYLVHLAGAGIADERWTSSRKKEIIDSRTKSIELIAKCLQSHPHFQIKAFVSASAIGFYGADTGDRHLHEAMPSGSDFLASVVRHWENASELVANVGIRTTKLRIGVVLSKEGGALPKIAQPVRLGVGAPLGSGKQWLSWIHIDDLCQMFIHALENPSWQGVYNAVAPTPVTNRELTRHIAKIVGRPLWLPSVPAFVLRAAFGEMADVVLGGSYVLNERIAQETDFKYQFPDIDIALTDLL
ncbi:MAG: TIGR01777 family oxidoreductase [Runella sp.]